MTNNWKAEQIIADPSPTEFANVVAEQLPDSNHIMDLIERKTTKMTPLPYEGLSGSNYLTRTLPEITDLGYIDYIHRAEFLDTNPSQQTEITYFINIMRPDGAQISIATSDKHYSTRFTYTAADSSPDNPRYVQITIPSDGGEANFTTPVKEHERGDLIKDANHNNWLAKVVGHLTVE